MSDTKTSIGFAVQYKHISGFTRLSTICNTAILAKANYLNGYFVNIDSTWTSRKVEEAWNSWLKIHEAQVVEVYTQPVDKIDKA